MTVVFALHTRDGMVVGADSQATERDRDLTYPVDKIHPLGDRGAWGGRGSRAVLLDVRERLVSTASEILDGGHLGHGLQDQVRPIFQHHYDAYIADVPGDTSEVQAPQVNLLVAAYDNDHQPWIVEVDPHCVIRRYEDVGFHAVGGGAVLAEQAAALITHFGVRELPLRHGLLVALRVLRSVSQVSLTVGGPANLWTVTPDGAARLSPEELERLDGDLERWRALEREGLDQVVRGTT